MSDSLRLQKDINSAIVKVNVKDITIAIRVKTPPQSTINSSQLESFHDSLLIAIAHSSILIYIWNLPTEESPINIAIKDYCDQANIVFD